MPLLRKRTSGKHAFRHLKNFIRGFGKLSGLKSQPKFLLQLQDEISDTENKIQASRRFYNGQTRDFNIKVQVFPTNMIAGMLSFKAYEFFKTDEAERQNVKVSF